METIRDRYVIIRGMEDMFAKGYAKCHCMKYDYYKIGFCEEREGGLKWPKFDYV